MSPVSFQLKCHLAEVSQVWILVWLTFFNFGGGTSSEAETGPEDSRQVSSNFSSLFSSPRYPLSTVSAPSLLHCRTQPRVV